jgi:hypothetical protein
MTKEKEIWCIFTLAWAKVDFKGDLQILHEVWCGLGKAREARSNERGQNLFDWYEFPNRYFPLSDIKLRVRAEYCHHHDALEGNVASNRPQLLERQFEKFEQASNILKSRDLGSVVCDIKFTELTYLDAFWRDYINGTLLEALKGVFITGKKNSAMPFEVV